VPFLKFSRDKRGYENYYLYDGKGRPRLLFWFRTPPQVKVGRAPFSDDVRRMVEAQNPGVSFDWARIMSTPIPAPDVDHWRERRRVEKAAKRAARDAEVAEAAEVAEEVVNPSTAEPEIVAAAEATATREDAEAVVEAAAGAQAETPAASSDVQSPQLQGHRHRRRRRRGRRGGGGGPSSGPETPSSGEV
jgi:hypothetical protein